MTNWPRMTHTHTHSLAQKCKSKAWHLLAHARATFEIQVIRGLFFAMTMATDVSEQRNQLSMKLMKCGDLWIFINEKESDASE